MSFSDNARGRVALSSLLMFASLLFASSVVAQENSPQYKELQRSLAQGWNTWNTRSVASQVLLPQGVAINIGIKHNAIYQEAWLPELQIGRQGQDAEDVTPGIHTAITHAQDGRYADLRVRWRGQELRIQSATVQNDLVLLVTPLRNDAALRATVVFSVSIVWNRQGVVRKEKDRIVAVLPGGAVDVFMTGRDSEDFSLPLGNNYFAATLDDSVGLSTGQARSLRDVQLIVDKTRKLAESQSGKNDVQKAIQSVLAWDTIYDPEHARVVTPVSRIWNVACGGYILFVWDNFFAATLAATYDHGLAYVNAMETLNDATPEGFPPNFSRAQDWKSLDRSQPPIGSMTVLALYKQFHDRWFLEDAYPRLLRWNEWWPKHREVQGYLVYGSGTYDAPWRQAEQTVNTLQAAKYESGLDNSPMYDGATYDPETHHMLLADVGLMSYYVVDCDALADIALELGNTDDAAVLRKRAEHYRSVLRTLWDQKTGAFLNKDLRTGHFSSRISPNIFYPMLAKAATPEQAKRLVDEHLLNHNEFWGDWVIPSIAKNDPAFHDQDYWRGRIWAPMNFLVYLGLRNYDFPEVRRELARKSFDLLMEEWRTSGHIHENYNGITGKGDDVPNSDRFYHWGALLGLPYLMEADDEKALGSTAPDSVPRTDSP
jgi:putative isomerase